MSIFTSILCATHGQWNCPVCQSFSEPISTEISNVTAFDETGDIDTNNVAVEMSPSPNDISPDADKNQSNAGEMTEASKRDEPTSTSWTPWSMLSGLFTFTATETKKQTVSEKARKKAKTCLIDDEVALQFFLDLGVSDEFLDSGKVLAWSLQLDDPAYNNICDYVARGQVYNGWLPVIKVISILRIIPRADSRECEDAPFDFSEDPKAKGKTRMMLWHGTANKNVTSILENGLKLPPTFDDPFFGGGIYFADMVANSARYCRNDNGSSYMILCDVLLGNIFEPTTFLPGIRSPPQGYDSVKACGCFVPDEQGNREIDGCVWPLGTYVQNVAYRIKQSYNEFAIYNTEQVHPKYLVKMDITYPSTLKNKNKVN